MFSQQEILSCEGIILRSLPYRENDRILTLMTKEQGILQAILYKKNMPAANCSLSSKIELIYKEGRGNLAFGLDIHLLDANEKIRNSLAAMLEVGKLLSITLKTQIEKKPAVEIYTLLRLLISLSSEMTDPEILTLIYSIKIFLLEGMIDAHMHCSVCHQSATLTHFSKGEWFCKEHTNEYAIETGHSVIEAWCTLVYIRQLDKIKKLTFSAEIKKQIATLLDDVMPS